MGRTNSHEEGGREDGGGKTGKKRMEMSGSSNDIVEGDGEEELSESEK